RRPFTLAAERWLLLRVLPGHMGRQCRLPGEQCAIAQSAAHSGRPHGRLFASDLRRADRAVRRRGDRARWIKHQSGRAEPAEHEKPGWIVRDSEPANWRQWRQLYGGLARTPP